MFPYQTDYNLKKDLNNNSTVPSSIKESKYVYVFRYNPKPYDFNYDYGDKLIILDGSGGPYTTLTGYSDWTILYKNYNTIIFWLDQDGDRYQDWGFKVNWYAMYDLQSSVIYDRQNNKLIVSSGGVLHYINSTDGNVISTFEYNEPILSYKLPIINTKFLEIYKIYLRENSSKTIE